MCDIDGCKSIDCARADLKKICRPEYGNYIDKRLAGDFAVHIARKSKDFEIEIKKLRSDLEKAKNAYIELTNSAMNFDIGIIYCANSDLMQKFDDIFNT